MTQVAIVGAAGRMGRMLLRAVDEHSALDLGAAVEHSAHALLGHDCAQLIGANDATGVILTDDIVTAAQAADVAIVFTLPESTLHTLKHCSEHQCAAVVGTTGLDQQQLAMCAAYAKKIPLLIAPNMSVGVNATFELLAKAAALLGIDYDVEIVEAHHRNKIDAPSGTALKMGEVIAAAQQRELSAHAVYARHGQVGARQPGEIGFQTIRGGDIVGEHTVIFAGDGERVEITHRSSSRSNFAAGAVRAAAWVVDQPPGIYGMNHVLGLACS